MDTRKNRPGSLVRQTSSDQAAQKTSKASNATQRPAENQSRSSRLTSAAAKVRLSFLEKF